MLKVTKIIFFLLMILSSGVYAVELESDFFNLKFSDGVVLQAVYEELLTSPDASAIANQPLASSLEGKIKQRFDNLFYVVSDIMDIHLREASFGVVVLEDDGQVADIVETFIGKRIESPSFYHTQANTIYISATSFRVGVFAHELGHAIIAHYFVVPPPEKMQEVLCGFVEYTLLKQAPRN